MFMSAFVPSCYCQLCHCESRHCRVWSMVNVDYCSGWLRMISESCAASSDRLNALLWPSGQVASLTIGSKPSDRMSSICAGQEQSRITCGMPDGRSCVWIFIVPKEAIVRSHRNHLVPR